ncbi:hypothetical protein NLI96_g3239 [Meripilus lineatus]|uniref:C2H2-type domain-containing protein n=1 Tax=Meripilus lineatus TaxID=2056292 RepID=A0AAD5V772_9APHY|nr:hypothetical protein NLI96_g3239 [Physisporinus lineatus]
MSIIQGVQESVRLMKVMFWLHARPTCQASSLKTRARANSPGPADALQGQFADVFTTLGNEYVQDLSTYFEFDFNESIQSPLPAPSPALPSPADIKVVSSDSSDSSTDDDGGSPVSSQYYTDAGSETGSFPNSPVSPCSSTSSYDFLPTTEELNRLERIPSPVNHSAFLLSRCTASSFLMSPNSTSSLSDWDRFSVTPPPPPPTTTSAESTCHFRPTVDISTTAFPITPYTTWSASELTACCTDTDLKDEPAPQPRSSEVALAVPIVRATASPAPCGGDWDFSSLSPPPTASATVQVESDHQVLPKDDTFTFPDFSFPSSFLSGSCDYREIKLEDGPPPRPRPALTFPAALQSVSTYSVAGGRDTTNFRHFCPVCDKGFKRAYNMRTHQEIHRTNRVKPWKCPVEDCQRAFARKHDLKRHIQALHPREKSELKSEYQ